MLEHSTLLIHPWTRSTLADGGAAWIRPITDAAAHPLGFVRSQVAPISWLFWARNLQLDVFETEDAAHLMRLTRSWTIFSTWDLHDAEDRPVGRIFPKSLIGDDGQCLGFLELAGRILDPSAQVLAKFSRKNGVGVELTFSSTSAANPFLRMLLLGCLLTLDPKPTAR